MDAIVPLLQWLERSPPAVAIAESSWAFPAIEAAHVIALTLTVGTVAVVDLRLLGLASTRWDYGTLKREVIPWTWAAFGGAVLTGSLMFTTQAAEYAANTAFRVKLVLLLLAGLNMLAFELVIARDEARWDRGTPIPWTGKIAALLSLVLWIMIVFFGRRVGFTMMPG